MASLILSGSTSGSVTLSSPAVSGTTTLTLPTTSGTVLTSASNTNFPAGSVLQVVSVNNKQATTTTGNTYVASTLAASITPTSSANKILIFGHFYYRTSASAVSAVTTIYRNATDLTSGTIGLCYNYAASTAVEMTTPFTILDSPATTSSTTYTLYFKRSDNAGTAYIGNGNMDSVITLMEIKG
jgi:hypothetical protein